MFISGIIPMLRNAIFDIPPPDYFYILQVTLSLKPYENQTSIQLLFEILDTKKYRYQMSPVFRCLVFRSWPDENLSLATTNKSLYFYSTRLVTRGLSINWGQLKVCLSSIKIGMSRGHLTVHLATLD